MAEIAENQEKTFKHYLEFPEEIRMFVINEQEPDDRVRFTRCSKLCNVEAKASRNFIRKLDLIFYSSTHIEFKLMYSTTHGCRRIFKEMYGEKVAAHYTLNYQFLGTVTLDGSRQLSQSAVESYKYLLQTHQNKFSKLGIYITKKPSEIWNNVDFGIKSLKELDELKTHGPVDVEQFLTKTHKPLKVLFVRREGNGPAIVNYKEIYRVQKLFWKAAQFDSQQFQKLSAEMVDISIVNLTEEDIFNFIRSWQNGTIGREIKSYRWNLRNSNFNRQKLFLLLGSTDQSKYRVIKHFKEHGKQATLCHDNWCLYFYT